MLLPAMFDVTGSVLQYNRHSRLYIRGGKVGSFGRRPKEWFVLPVLPLNNCWGCRVCGIYQKNAYLSEVLSLLVGTTVLAQNVIFFFKKMRFVSPLTVRQKTKKNHYSLSSNIFKQCPQWPPPCRQPARVTLASALHFVLMDGLCFT